MSLENTHKLDQLPEACTRWFIVHALGPHFVLGLSRILAQARPHNALHVTNLLGMRARCFARFVILLAPFMCASHTPQCLQANSQYKQRIGLSSKPHRNCKQQIGSILADK